MFIFVFAFLLLSTSAQNLLQVASNAGLTSLVTAVEVNSLAATLNGTGPFTVFAPTNQAFTDANVNVGTASAAVADVLTYHVINGNVSAAQVTNGAVATLLGTRIFLNVDGSSNVFVNGIQVSAADNYASNGVAHVIGTVLTPPTNSISQLAASTASLSTLASFVTAAGLFDDLNGSTVLTVFAPTNAAFDALPACLVSFLSSNVAVLENVLNYHVVAGTIFSTTIASGSSSVSPLYAADGNIAVLKNGSGVFLNGAAQVTSANILGLNGVVHIIDQVIVPPNLALTCAPTSSATSVVAPWLMVALSVFLTFFL